MREGRGRDDLTDEIATKKKRKRKERREQAGVLPHENHVPQRKRHPGAVGRPGAREVGSIRL